jgi:magnesium chelatase subunit I
MHQIIEETVAQARLSPHINQASGVSVRTSIACTENMVSSAERRAIVTGEQRVLPRICDLAHMAASCRGKIELMLAEDGQGSEDKLIDSLTGQAIKTVFDQHADVTNYLDIADQFTDGLTLAAGDDLSADDLAASMKHIDGLLSAASQLAKDMDMDPSDPQALAATGEFILEALYVNNHLSKSVTDHGGSYRR